VRESKESWLGTAGRHQPEGIVLDGGQDGLGAMVHGRERGGDEALESLRPACCLCGGRGGGGGEGGEWCVRWLHCGVLAVLLHTSSRGRVCGEAEESARFWMSVARAGRVSMLRWRVVASRMGDGQECGNSMRVLSFLWQTTADPLFVVLLLKKKQWWVVGGGWWWLCKKSSDDGMGMMVVLLCLVSFSPKTKRVHTSKREVVVVAS